MLALVLGLGLSEVCIPIVIRCLYALLLYSKCLIILQNHIKCVCGVVTTVVLKGTLPATF
jgi:hypothetical protein